MTNYNDGKWHGWNGGECPVHPCSMVEGMYLRDGEPAPESPITDDADDFDWRHDGKNRLIAFRVIKEHKEPREWSVIVDKYGDVIGCTNRELTSELGFKYSGHTLVKVREVIE